LPAAKAIPKEMLALVDKPVIQYIVEEAVHNGITDILIVTGRGKSSLQDHFDRSFELEYHLEQKGKHDELDQMRAIANLARIHTVRQGEPLGLGHAISMAEDHVGDEPFVVLLGDDVMQLQAGVLAGMLAAHRRHGASILALKHVSGAEISAYGSAAVEPIDQEESLVLVHDLVEKPKPEEAPSDLGVMGRYVLTPAIFDALARTKPGSGGEIQLTDAITLLLETEPVYGYTFEHGRFDAGNKLDYLRATVELALERPDLGPPFLAYLEQRFRRP
jgi:UTP--glucose-1-phosphate uridylyltransferase